MDSTVQFTEPIGEIPLKAKVPQTIEKLKDYCREKKLPLKRMRFYLGENCLELKAYGIYNTSETYIVYKNRANGVRTIRYSGPDEAAAVEELFTKLLEECRNRGIYPDDALNKDLTEDAAARRIPKFLLPIPHLFALSDWNAEW